MVTTIETRTANEAWCSACNTFLSGQFTKDQPSRIGDTKELLHATFHIENPLQRWVVSRMPAINPAFAIVETFWVLSGRNDSRFLEFWNRQLSNYAGKCNSYHGAYGFRLRRNLNFDQVDQAYCALKSNHESRQVVLQIWDSRKDLPWKTGRPRSKDIPCNLLAMLKIRENRLEWTQVVRSNDLFLGVPHDFAQFMMFQEIFAGWLGIEVGSYFHLSDSLHVYEQDLNKLELVSDIEEAPNTDSLGLSKRESEQVIGELCDRIRLLSRKRCSKKQLIDIADWQNSPEAYRNLLRIVAAESARKRKWKTQAITIANKCTNPALRQLWSRWLQRVDGKQSESSVLQQGHFTDEIPSYRGL